MTANKHHSLRAAIIGGLFFLLVSQHASGQRLEGQTVTWADFNYVSYVASSMSHVYFATSEGITRYNKLERRWEEPLTGRVGIEFDAVSRVWVDTFDEDIFAETSLNLYEYDPFFQSWSIIHEIPQIRSDTRHVATPDGMFPPFGFNFLADGGLVDPRGRAYGINDVLDDGAGTLWMGTWGYGAARAETGSNVIELLPYGLLQNHVSAIHPDGADLWLAGEVRNSYRTGLTRFDPDNNSFEYVESGLNAAFPVHDVHCLTGDSAALYIGTEYGVLVFDKQLGKVTDRVYGRNGLIGDEVESLQLVGDSLFVGTTDGLTLLDLASDSIGYINPREFLNQIIYDFELVDSTLWIAASSGAYRLSLVTGKLQKFQDPDQVIFGRAFAVESYEEAIWLSSEYGVVRLDTKTGESEAYKLEPDFGLPRALAAGDRVAATASRNGFTLLFRDRDKPESREFSTQDGLPSPYVYSLLMDGDFLWVGTDRGLTRFLWNNPDRID